MLVHPIVLRHQGKVIIRRKIRQRFLRQIAAVVRVIQRLCPVTGSVLHVVAADRPVLHRRPGLRHGAPVAIVCLLTRLLNTVRPVIGRLLALIVKRTDARGIRASRLHMLIVFPFLHAVSPSRHCHPSSFARRMLAPSCLSWHSRWS